MNENEQEPERDVSAELDALAAAAEKESAGEWEPGEEPEPETAGPDPQTVQVVQSITAVAFQIVAARRGDHWRLSNEELQGLSEPAAECLEKYAPNMAVGPEAALVIAAGMIVAPRLMTDRAIAEQQAKQARERRRQQQQEAEEGAARESHRPEPA